MRLTVKDKEVDLWFVDDKLQNIAINKLGQLEDIEDELGIDLITLFKALKNGCWYIHNDGHKYYEFCKKPSLVINWNNWCLRFDYEHNYELTKYKDKENGWALTKEELE